MYYRNHLQAEKPEEGEEMTLLGLAIVVVTIALPTEMITAIYHIHQPQHQKVNLKPNHKYEDNFDTQTHLRV